MHVLTGLTSRPHVATTRTTNSNMCGRFAMDVPTWGCWAEKSMVQNAKDMAHKDDTVDSRMAGPGVGVL